MPGLSNSTQKTQQATHWAVRTFNAWVKQRNQKTSAMFQCPTDLLSSVYPPAIVDQWLAAFIMEVRKADGGYYTPDSLNCVLAGLQREMRTHLGRAAPNIIDRKSDLFPKKRNALDNQCRMLRSKGIGVVKKRAPAILPHVEKRLWDEGVLSVKTPEGLLNAVFYSNFNLSLNHLTLIFGQTKLMVTLYFTQSCHSFALSIFISLSVGTYSCHILRIFCFVQFRLF